MRNILILAVAAAMAGCVTSPTAGGSLVRDADDRMVESCEYIGDVGGSSGWGGAAARRGVESSRNQARNQAADRGGTHIVWSDAAGGYSPSAFGRAYRCD